MEFRVNKLGTYRNQGKNIFFLCEDNWDDFGYKTTFHARYYDCVGESLELGSVQIGFKGMKEGKTIDNIPNSFQALPNEFFSLGISEEYYEKISKLEDSVREQIYTSLHDMAYNLEIFDSNEDELVVQNSLLRGHSAFTIRSQLNRISKGGARLTPYHFQFNSAEQTDESDFSQISLNFDVIPDSNPPTNIHVIIGRNGTGKTRLLQDMIRSLQTGDTVFGYFEESDNPYGTEMNLFANVLCVAFSPFDDFSSVSENKDSILPFSFIGLDKQGPNLLKTLKEQFVENFANCMSNQSKKKRWVNTIQILKSDPVFDESQVQRFIAEWIKDKEDEKTVAKDSIKQTFSKLSSGHKVILLIITACVDKLEEKSIVFLDEPENHLHPPLLSAFTRALSYLLIDRNGVAIISTHSPVVLQEVPSSCVWALRRVNTMLIAERLGTETFGTSISSLTSEVFGLEITEAGFHSMIRDDVFNDPQINYEDIMNKYNKQLGNEAQSILRSLIAVREKGG